MTLPRRPRAPWAARLRFAAALTALVGCPRSPAATAAPTPAPSSNVFLRTSFDTDPSDYLGRFFPAGLADLDESSGMDLACSVHISWRYIPGGGVETSEVLQASSGVRARLGLPQIGEVEGRRGEGQTTRVHYTLTGKMVSTIDDPAALSACCRAQPDQCTDRMVGEFLQGTGSLYVATRRGGRVQAGARLGDVGAEVVRSHGETWRRAATFPEPVYFAFKVTPTPYTQQAVRTCPDAGASSDADGALRVVARSEALPSEAAARAAARADLTAQVGRATALVAEAEQKGTTLGIQEADWCVERAEVDGEDRYTATLLGVVSAAEQARVRALPLPTPVTEAVAAGCPRWVQTPPSSPDGLQVVGFSGPSASEQAARRRARRDARLQLGRAAGVAGLAQAHAGTLPVAERDWCVQETRSGDRVRYTAYLLGFLSTADQDRIRERPMWTAPLAAWTPPQSWVTRPPVADAAEPGTLLDAVLQHPFETDRVALLLARGPQQRRTCAELAALLGALHFEPNRRTVALALRDTVVDPEDVGALLPLFTFLTDQALVRGHYAP